MNYCVLVLVLNYKWKKDVIFYFIVEKIIVLNIMFNYDIEEN